MPTFGRQVLVTTGTNIQVTADGRPMWKPGGVTIDWAQVAAVTGSPFTIPLDLTTVPVGQKYLRYGQILTRITLRPTQTVTDTGATSGTFTLAGTRPDTGVAGTSVAIAWNAAAATVQTALEAVFGVGNVVVTGGPGPGTAWVVTFQGTLSGLTVAALVPNNASLVGGVAAVVQTQAGGNFGYYGPYDPAATDGRQTLTRGECFVLNETDLQSGLVVGLPTGPTDNPGVFYGGLVFRDRLLATTGAASLAAGPTFATLEPILPMIQYAAN